MPKTDPASLPSAYDHLAAQAKWYPHWESRGYFHADPQKVLSGEKRPFSVVIPPPNVTGALHLGHALNNTLQDVLCRRKRMEGFEVLWMPGTDHAGIATQAVVERRLLAEEKLSRHDLGRDGLVKRIWQWKEQYEKRITGQLKQLGCSCDWERQRFTLDDQCARAVRETFFKLFSDGKVYRGKRLVNWDTFLQTAVSDDEVFHEEVKGHFWSFHYPVVKPQAGEPTRVTIATTRPETMLGDTAVAVHPEPAKALDAAEADLRAKLAAAPAKEREPIEKQLEALADRRVAQLPTLQKLAAMAKRGVMLELPLCDRQIPLIADEWAKPELGSGCVKITPAHDPNDYEVFGRHPAIGAINILRPDGTLADGVPEKYRGLTMPQARKAVVEDLAAAGFHNPEEDVEDRLIDLAHSDRSKTPIEPYLADQWFVKMDELAQSAIDAVTSGEVKIIPERYGRSYLDWLGEKRDWPVGRQLWWGHRIVVWNGDSEVDGQVAIERTEQLLEACGVNASDYLVEPLGHHRFRVCVASQRAIDCLSAIEKFQNERRSIDFEREPGMPHRRLPNHQLVGFVAATPIAQQLPLSFQVRQDGEVLDTWFSSALWPFSTMGWPEQTDLLKAFYPTSVLLTSRDIITLWVARMVLMGKYLKPLGDDAASIPFPQVYIHPKILDGFGETMSKSKGNGVDPLDVIERYGADALRFGIAYLTTETQDVRLPVDFVCPHCDAQVPQTKKNRVQAAVECPKCSKSFRTQWAEKEADLALPRGAVTSERFELGRNFCNKVWNASRFALANLQDYPADPAALDSASLRTEDRWLLSRLSSVTTEVSRALDEYRFADAARSLYEFAWNELCSFYVEITKARFAEPGPDRVVAQRVLAHALDTLLRLLHPIAPFLTEEVWSLLGEVAPVRGVADPQPAAESVCVAAWPEADTQAIDKTIEEQFAKFQGVLGAVREVRQAQQVPGSESVEFTVLCDAATAELLGPMTPYFQQMARAVPTAMGPAATPADLAAAKPLGGYDTPIEVHVDVARFLDKDAERSRLEKERANLTKFIASLGGKLAKEAFTARAPADVVAAERAKLAEAQSQLASVAAALAKLG
ncbi:MAG: valine--tRNA ligase [Lacipirellulaceae bacterium]